MIRKVKKFYLAAMVPRQLHTHHQSRYSPEKVPPGLCHRVPIEAQRQRVRWEETPQRNKRAFGQVRKQVL